MKILHFYKVYHPDGYGGVQEFIRQLTAGTARAGLDTQILTLTASEPGLIRVDGIPVHRVKRLFKFASTDFSFRIMGVFKCLAAEADLIHYHFPWPLADLVSLGVAPRKPSLVTYHSDIVAQKRLLFFYRPLMKRFLRSMPVVVAGSPNYLASSPILRSLSDKTRCIPFGLPPATPSTEARLEFWRARLPERFFLYVGAFRYYKGLEYLLAAVKSLPCPLVLVGTGAFEKHLRAQAADQCLTNVHFLGALPEEDKEAVLSLALGFVLPSHLRSEAYSLSLLEGARNGKPLVCCEIGTGTTFINVDGETGLVVPPADPAALREALMALWQDPELAARLGAGARRRFEELFTVDKMTRAYIDLYREFLTQPETLSTR